MGKQKERYIILPPCEVEFCRQKCTSEINEHKAIYQISTLMGRTFIINNTQTLLIKTQTPFTSAKL